MSVSSIRQSVNASDRPSDTASVIVSILPADSVSVTVSDFPLMAGLLVMTSRQPSHPTLFPLSRPLTEASDNMTIIPLLEARFHPFTLQIKRDFYE